MLFRHPSTLAGFRFFVGHAVSPAIFHDLANIHATLASYFWLGFVTTGLSPDKKRLAWLGAQRPRHGSPIRERGLDRRIRIRISEVNHLEAGSGLSIAYLVSRSVSDVRVQELNLLTNAFYELA